MTNPTDSMSGVALPVVGVVMYVLCGLYRGWRPVPCADEGTVPTDRNALLYARSDVLGNEALYAVMTGVLWLPVGVAKIIYAMHVCTYGFSSHVIGVIPVYCINGIQVVSSVTGVWTL